MKNKTYPAPRAKNLTRGSAYPRFASKTSGRGEPGAAELRGAASNGSAATSKSRSIKSGKTTPAVRFLRIGLSMVPPTVTPVGITPSANEDFSGDHFLARSARHSMASAGGVSERTRGASRSVPFRWLPIPGFDSTLLALDWTVATPIVDNSDRLA